MRIIIDLKSYLFCCFCVVFCFFVVPLSAAINEYNDLLSVYQNSLPSKSDKLKEYLKNFQISGAVGTSQLGINHGGYQFNAGEHDTIVTNNTGRSLNLKAGVGYNFFPEKLARNSFLNNILFELNFYRFAGSVDGEVWEFDAPPPISDVTFHLNINSSKRLMLDLKPVLFTYKGLSPYLVLGTGIGWLKLDYNENESGIGRSSLIANSTTEKLALDVGGGLKYAFNDHLGLTLEYLHTRFGKVKIYNAYFIDRTGRIDPSLEPPTFTNLYTNTGLFGFYFKI